MRITVGDKAPAFELFDTEKQQVTLADFAGKNVLLLFFPLAFTSVCTAELCGIRDNIGRYSNANAEVLAISVDSLFTLKQFKEAQGFNFTLLSDFNKEVSAAYGALYETFGFGMKGVSKRAAFIVDGNGIIQYAEVLENAGAQPDFEAINAKLEN